jgi:hypothetical protein
MLHGLAVNKPHVIADERQSIIRNVIVPRILFADHAHQTPEFKILGRRATFFLEQFQRDRPFILLSAVLARQMAVLSDVNVL